MYQPFLKQQYRETIAPELQKELGLKNVHQVPALTKIVINTGLEATLDKNAVEETIRDITNISGQKPIVTRARKSISNFKVREGMPLGVKVTLRGNSMYEFLARLLVVALPGIRDFRGIPTRMDGNGNYTLGITDHTIFPEISMDGNKRTVGMDITFVTSATNDKDGQELLKKLGMPFRKKDAA